ncbi:MFS transporter [Francisella sp. 19X1-34]|uniref:MFS transporter n=1 Tax=Francisella sp. 19X1-34 TaxID=3087177 RepID=UPI002E3230E4|nr:MFS transporter [Francisella sp. 19X1-34]MED7787683.1 MFS transporter [Francisella sp. 19X1-34]
MKYNIRRWNPFLISIPDFGIGVFWALSGTVVPWIAYQHTKSSFLVMCILSLGAFTGIFMQVISGVLSDRMPYNPKYGKRTPWLLGGVIFTAIFAILLSLVPNFFTLFIVAFLVYASLNFFQGVYYTMVMEAVDPDQIGLANTLARTTAQIGATAISFISAWVFLNFGVFWTCIIIALMLIIPAFSILPWLLKERPERISETKLERKGFKFDFHKYPKVLQLFITATAFYATYACIVPMLTPYFSNTLGLDKENIATAMTIFAFVSIFYGIFASRLNDWFNRKKVLISALGVFTIIVIAGNFVDSSTKLYFFMGAAGIGYLAAQIALYTYLAEVAPEGRLGEYQGLLNLFISASQFILMPLLGELIDLGLHALLYPFATIMIVIAFLNMIRKVEEN